MKNFKLIIYFTLISYVLIGCTKEDIKTQGELIQDEINQIINEYNISLCDVYIWDKHYDEWDQPHSKEKFELRHGILIIDNDYYSLEKLTHWYFYQSGDTHFISFSF
jgi:hypothetical protein